MRFILAILAFETLGYAYAAGDPAERILAAVDQIAWRAPLGSPERCAARAPAQMDIYATQQWTHYCPDTRNGPIQESFFYVFGEATRPERLRVDLRMAEEQANGGLLAELSSRLTRRFGPADREPAMMEVGFRTLRYGQPVAGEHWKHGEIHYFLHANQSNSSPMGVRRGPQLIVMHERLFAERVRDEFILQAEGFGSQPRPPDLIESALRRHAGEGYGQVMDVLWKTPQERTVLVLRLDDQLQRLLEGVSRAPRAEQAYRLLAADSVVAKLTGTLVESPPGGEREAAEAATVRAFLAKHGAKLGHMTHSGGLEYRRDLLWRVWREYADTEAGELAFLALQRHGWNTDPNEGCPQNPDLFREAIEKGEAFLRDHPRSAVRTEVVYTLAVANESWWSIAHAPAGDPIVEAPPYPRRVLNQQLAGAAREQAIRYYRELLQLAPESAQAASARRRLPRLQLGIDTGQRQFFCFYC